MPTSTIGNKTSIDRKEFLELKSKGEKVTIRIANSDYYYEGKHFQESDGEWTVTNCSRINEEQTCDLCEQYFEINREIKEVKKAKDEKKVKELDKEARKVKANLSFYYPVLDRDTGLAAIFKTSLMVRLGLEEKKEDGVDILNSDFVVKRTEKPGSYYTLTKVDSAEVVKFTKEEKEELEKAKKMNVGEIVGGKKGSMDFGEEDTSDFDDVPF